MSEFPMYPNDDDDREQAKADARALWAVRVLDAYAEKHPDDACVCRLCGHFAHSGGDAARIAAATALVAANPSLDPDGAK